MTEPLILHTLAANPIVQGALGGWLAAARVDYTAFQSWQSLHDAARYHWGVAAWKWFQGAVSGAVLAAGLTSLL